MNKVIIYTNPVEGNVCVMHAAQNKRGRVLVANTVYEMVELAPAVNVERDGQIYEEQPPTMEQRVKTPAKYREETDDEFAQRIALKHVQVRALNPPAGVASVMPKNQAQLLGLTFEQLPFTVVDASAVPSDRTFRNAWTLAEGTVTLDMAKAREIHRANIRRARQTLLEALDVEYQRADELGIAGAASKLAIKAQKQELRDLPDHPSIEAAKNTAQLKAAWPSLLSPNPYTEKP